MKFDLLIIEKFVKQPTANHDGNMMTNFFPLLVHNIDYYIKLV